MSGFDVAAESEGDRSVVASVAGLEPLRGRGKLEL